LPPCRTPLRLPESRPATPSTRWRWAISSRALALAAKLGLADLLKDGPRGAGELAAATQTHAPSLARVLRLLASAGVFAERPDGRFALTPVGEPLRADALGSVRALVLLLAGVEVQDAWKDLEYCASRNAFRSFLDKVNAALAHGIHLLLIDLHPPTPRDPRGLPAAVWEQLTGQVCEPPPGKPLSLAAYPAGPVPTAYVQPLAVGDVLPDMPLFLTPEEYVNVPLEKTYLGAYEGVPRFYRGILEA
jgi:hypothetical protein